MRKPLLEDLDLLPGVDEVNTVIKEMNCSKTPGADGIHGELYKALSTTAFDAFHDILVSIWEEECMPADFCDAIIVTLYNNEGEKSDRENYRSIFLRSIAEKSWSAASSTGSSPASLRAACLKSNVAVALAAVP